MLKKIDETTLEQEAQGIARQLFGEQVSIEVFQEVREGLRMQHQYPGRHVAYLDSWKQGEKGPRLQRTVVAEALDPIELNHLIDALPDELKATVRTRHVVDPSSPTRDHPVYRE